MEKSQHEQNTKRIVNSETFPNISQKFYDAEVVMKLTEQYDGRKSWHAWKMLNKLKNWNKDDKNDAFSRSTDKPRMDHNVTIICIRAAQGHSYGFAINPDFYLKEIRLRWNQHILHTVNSSNF